MMFRVAGMMFSIDSRVPSSGLHLVGVSHLHLAAPPFRAAGIMFRVAGMLFRDANLMFKVAGMMRAWCSELRTSSELHLDECLHLDCIGNDAFTWVASE